MEDDYPGDLGLMVLVPAIHQWDFQGPPKDMGPPYDGKRDPYYSHTTPIRIPKDMGMVCEAYHKGVPLLGVPGITLEFIVLE